MDISYKDLIESLQTGFIDGSYHSKNELIPQLLVNNKIEGVKFLTTVQRELQGCDEFWLSVAFVTTSGLAALMNTLIDLKVQGIKGKLLVSSYLNFTQPEALRRLLYFDNIELRIAVDDDFHSKGYLFKNGHIYDLIIGSSNLTSSALCSNKEWNLKISATPVSHIISSALREFKYEFDNAIKVDDNFIRKYNQSYINQQHFAKQQTEFRELIASKQEIIPNNMQVSALVNIKRLRSEDKTKALLISATGTGKTYLSAFDAKEFNPKRLLFVVHRHRIVKDAMKTFKAVFGNNKTMSDYSSENSDINKDFIFTTIQTLSREEHLNKFSSTHFDYIVIDESHRAGADTYQRIIDHFRPKFLLGMTATPERTDGYDIFKLYDHNIAYEIRLNQALEENMLSPFHYYGVTDITIGGKVLNDNSDFRLLTAEERVDRIIEKTKVYGCDSGKVRGLIFCSRKDECTALSNSFNIRGYKTIALTGDNSELDRDNAITKLESDSNSDFLDYIFTVDIFNEGIDIPQVNQVIMLRPTQSAIVFVQQLGRGLRKAEGKEYLTVIDFIGNYNNNFLVPIALYGDTSYNKDTIRKYLASGSSFIPGTSTINFDKISKERIFDAINSANMQLKKDLIKDYQLLKFKLGNIPMMVDFIEHGSRDAQLYVNYSRSYYNFVEDLEESIKDKIDDNGIKLLELFSKEINNSKRVEESIILKLLLERQIVDYNDIKKIINSEYDYAVTDKTIESSINNLNFEFITEKKGGVLLSVREIYKLNIINLDENVLTFHPDFEKILNNQTFRDFLNDNIEYSIKTFNKLFKKDFYYKGFVLYRKYSRKDTFRILNWGQKPVEQNVGGYKISKDKSNCPIFVNYQKEEDIANTIKYEDKFLNNSEFEWFSKSKRTLESSDVKDIKEYESGLRIPLFIKKSNDEGSEFYYMGDVTPIKSSFTQEKMKDDKGNDVPVVKLRFTMNHPVEDSLYEYITKT